MDAGLTRLTVLAEKIGAEGWGSGNCSNFFAECSNSKEVLLGLASIGRHGTSELGSFSASLETRIATSTFGLTASDDKNSELLPIPLSLASSFFQSSLDPLGIVFSPECENLALGVLSALNFLYGAGWTKNPIRPDVIFRPGPAQCKSLVHIYSCCERALKADPVTFELFKEIRRLSERKASYGGAVVSVKRDLVADKVIPAWPKVGNAAVLPILEMVDEELRDELLDPDGILLPESEWPSSNPKSKVHATPGEWYSCVKAGYERGLMAPIAEEDISRNNFGDKVTQGAMGWISLKPLMGLCIFP